jgi:hypothetical protein
MQSRRRLPLRTSHRRHQDAQESARSRAAAASRAVASRAHKLQAADRLEVGALWQDHGLVFASSIGTPLDRHNVLREFRNITETAGLGAAGVPAYVRLPA